MLFDLAAARFLISDLGRAAAVELEGKDTASISLAKSLRKKFPAAFARALIDQESGRRSLRGKHPRASELFASKVAAEQSSAFEIASWRARRFEGCGLVADIGCGIGIDSEALAQRGPVIAVDADPGKLVLARANLEGAPHETWFVRALVPPLPAEVDYFFADPDRRIDGRRQVDPEKGSPALSILLREVKSRRGMGVKLAPGLPIDSIQEFGELEFISRHRQLREAVLWTGELATVNRRVSCPDSGLSLTGDPKEEARSTDHLGRFLLEPDPALSRSKLFAAATAGTDIEMLRGAHGYATVDEPFETPWFKLWPVETTLKADAARLNAHLRDRGVGRVDLSRRGVDADMKDWARKLRTPGKPSVGRQIHFVNLEGRVRCVVAEIPNSLDGDGTHRSNRG
ncbi:MAG: hypothetical protein V3W41_00975 [Planctomycetota bacterium]